MSDDSVSSENTYILDAESSAEMARLMQQDRMITEGMGGLFPERDDVSTMHDILDVASWHVRSHKTWAMLIFI